MSRSLRVAVWLVRAWTDLYTWRMNDDARAVRVAEIESDLWECANERRQDRVLPLVILARLVKGMPDDLAWRTSHFIHPRAVRRTAAFGAIATVVTAVVAIVVWIVVVAAPAKLPEPRSMMLFSAAPAPPLPPPPPPPPPPPCQSPASMAGCRP